MTRTLTIKKQTGSFVVDETARPGSPPCGYGRTMKEAIGDYMLNNQEQLGVTFELEPSAQSAEDRRRKAYEDAR